jgi:transposase InsO family protein
MLTDRGSEYRGNKEHHEYELYCAVEEGEHSCTKAYSPQTNGICERFHRTIQQEFYSVVFIHVMFQKLVLVFVDLSSKFLLSLTVLPSGNGHSLRTKILRVSLTNSQFLSRDVYRTKVYQTIEELQKDLDDYLKKYNNERLPSREALFRKNSYGVL